MVELCCALLGGWAAVLAVAITVLNLLRLQRFHRVPEWVALPVDGLMEFLAADGLGERIARRLAGLKSDCPVGIAADVQRMIMEAPLPGWMEDELSSVAFISGPAAGYVSVRSSADDEDGAAHSFAGVHESFLYVRGAVSVAHHVRRVWASGYQERALLYRQAKGLEPHPVPMAVVIQRMVDAAVSGVVFTADPVSQDPLTLVVSALYGLGEGLVGAGLAADQVCYRKATRVAKQTPAHKETRYVLDRAAGEGLVEEPVPAEARDLPALSDAQRDAVIQAALSIEKSWRRPQDIEFCFDAHGALYILQTRDITTVADAGPAAGNMQVWDNSNIIESYSGVTSPMTFSFIRHAYTVVYHAMAPHELLQVYREMETRLLWNWQAPIINDFYVMIHYGLLRNFCRDWCGDESRSLQNDLICGNGDIESTAPTQMLMRLALCIRRNPAILARFRQQDHHTLARQIPSDPACAEVAAEIAVYLKRYGFRCINELKLEEPSLRETPAFVYQILQNYLGVEEAMLDADAMAAREQDIRRHAEEVVDAALGKRSIPWLRRLVFRLVLRRARKGVRNRENMRFARTRIYGVLRELLQAMGHHLTEAGLLATPDLRDKKNEN